MEDVPDGDACEVQLLEPDCYCPIIRGERPSMKVRMAANRDLPKLRSSCTTVVIARADLQSQCRNKFRWPLLANEIAQAGRCRDGRTERESVQAVSYLDRRDYREGNHMVNPDPALDDTRRVVDELYARIGLGNGAADDWRDVCVGLL